MIDDLAPCPLCAGPVSFFTRWRGTGSAPFERLYVWIECCRWPPCLTGPCHKDDNDALNGWLKLVEKEKQRGFALLEVMLALVISMIVLMATVTGTNNMRRAIDSSMIRIEMGLLQMSAYVSADHCKSVSVSGGTTPLGVCGTPTTPQTIQVLYKDGTPVHTNSKYLLQADCQPGFYQLQVKSALATKVDPLTGKSLGVSWLMPAQIRFAAKAWLTGASGCP